MKLEVGKYYRTRDGQKVLCKLTDLPGTSYTCVVSTDTSYWLTTPIGEDCRNHNRPHDIIAEWTDKPDYQWQNFAKWHKWAAFDENGECFAYSAPPIIQTHFWRFQLGICELILPEYAPKLTCDWKDSLMERPVGV